MNVVKCFLVGGYAYYRKKKFSHHGAINMVATVVCGLPSLILMGLIDNFLRGKSNFLVHYSVGLIVAFVVTYFFVSNKLEGCLRSFEGRESLSDFSKEIRFHSIVVYIVLFVFFFVWNLHYIKKTVLPYFF